MSSDDDFNLALALSKSEQEVRKVERERKLQEKRAFHDNIERERELAARVMSSDADYALALQLQENLQREEEQEQYRRKAQGKEPANGSNVTRAIGNLFGINSPTNPPAQSLIPRVVPPGGCYKCQRVLQFGTKVTAMSRTYCASCFVCEGCNAPISGQFFPHEPPVGNPSTTSNPVEIEPYCYSCVRELFGDKCCLCSEVLEGRYLRHAFFENEKYCVAHEDMRKVCFSCSRLEPVTAKTGKEGFVDFPDGRASCSNCIMTAVLDSTEAGPLYLDAVDFMEKALGLRIPPGMREVPILAVDLPSLNEQKQFSSNKRNATVRGLTMYTTSTRPNHSVRYIEPGYYQWNPYTGQFLVSPSMSLPRYTHDHRTTREVTAVLVLFGLPRDLTASILAHEATHVYFKLSQEAFPGDITPLTEEGMCQFIAERYLAHVRSERDQSRPTKERPRGEAEAHERDAKLRQYFQYSIQTDRSDTYGEGFRKAKSCVDALGLDVVLEHIKGSKNLPNI